METKLATIQKIHSIQPHPNAEVTRLEVGKVKEWPVVVPKGEFKNGDLVIFITIDSIVPNTNPYFAFMERQKYRVWNARFKGVPSQGLVCPLSLINNIVDSTTGGWKEGDDVSKILGITKYEKTIDALISGDIKRGFPTNLISITDEDNLLNYPEALNELDGKEIYITKKMDGASSTIINDGGVIRVCSRRFEQKEGTGFWKIFEKYDLPNKLKLMGKSLSIQAECCGGKIQGNPLGLTESAIFVFNVKETDTVKWYGKDEISNLCKDLSIPMVEIIKTFVWNNSENTISELQELANSVIYKTATGKVRVGEGIVIRPSIPFYSNILGKLWSAKIINQNYK
jgi:RNA ligase (TIGR02306 family)